jgi:hypothetical protein
VSGDMTISIGKMNLLMGLFEGRQVAGIEIPETDATHLHSFDFSRHQKVKIRIKIANKNLPSFLQKFDNFI